MQVWNVFLMALLALLALGVIAPPAVLAQITFRASADSAIPPAAGACFASVRVTRNVEFSEMWNLSQTMGSAGHAVVSWFTCGACGQRLFGDRPSTGPGYAARQLRVTVGN